MLKRSNEKFSVSQVLDSHISSLTHYHIVLQFKCEHFSSLITTFHCKTPPEASFLIGG